MADEEKKPIEEAGEFAKDAPVEAADQILQAAKQAESSPAVEAFQAAKDALTESVERIAPPPPAHKEEAQAHLVSDTTELFGRVIPLPVYTVVFGALAVLTLLEVGVSQLPHGFLTIPLLLGIATAKAGLVVWFYMHLNHDSRIFALTLAIPMIMVVLATFFLMIVPTGY
jgi:cytochrome c oxidase subunit 4